MTPTRLHFNKPQLRSMIIGAPNEVFVAGRATGKTEGVLAPKTSNVYFKTMPRGTGVFLGATYNQLLTRTIPGLMYGWEKLGYIRNVHYHIGTKPPEKWIKTWNWRGPYRPPISYQYFVSWWNSAGGHLVSQDRQGSANGITIDWIIGDEAKLLNAERYRTELIPANRGYIPEFTGNPYHHGITLTTDMPVGTAGRWILEYVDKVDREKINDIWKIQTVRYQLRHLLSNEKRKTYQDELKKQIAVLDDELQDLRRQLLYYHEASTIDNIHALGIEYIKQQLRDTTPFHFDTQILNIKPMKLEDGFYPDFDEEKHGYFAADNDYLDNLEYDFAKIAAIDCRRDSDINANMPIHISMDYNRRIHPMVVAQVYSDEIRVLKGVHSMYPAKLKECIDMFLEYYRPHKRKFIYYWYDHTAVGDQHETRICDDVIRLLRKGGWSVKGMYIGKSTTHESRYRMFGHLLKESGKYNKKLTVNRENCDKLILSIYQAQAEQKKDGYGKDKSTERDKNFPADEATHYSEALDTLCTGILESKLPYSNESKGGGGMTMTA
jgi:hypothetical protein